MRAKAGNQERGRRRPEGTGCGGNRSPATPREPCSRSTSEIDSTGCRGAPSWSPPPLSVRWSVKLLDHQVQAATDAREAAWFAVDDLPKLCFDHDDIVAAALKRLQGKVRYQPIGFELLPPKFSLTQLQRMYEIILERELDKRNFRKKVLSLGILQDVDEVEQDVAHRAARLYRFDERKYRQLVKDGFNFEL